MYNKEQIMKDWKKLRKHPISEMLIELDKMEPSPTHDGCGNYLRGATMRGWIDIMTENWQHIRHLHLLHSFIPFICKYFPEKVECLGEDVDIGQ